MRSARPGEVVPLVLLAIPAVWMLSMFFAARFTGWAKLAEDYRTAEEPPPTLWRFQTALMRWASHYGNCLNVGASVRGLYLVPMLLFRTGHAPLLIPWSDITAAEKKVFLSLNIELRFLRVPEIPVVITMDLARKIAGASAGAWVQGQKLLAINSFD